MCPNDPAPDVLDYNSDGTSVKPVLKLTFPTDTNAQAPNYVYVQFTFNGTSDVRATYPLAVRNFAAAVICWTGSCYRRG
jgi:hypothetical protein